MYFSVFFLAPRCYFWYNISLPLRRHFGSRLVTRLRTQPAIMTIAWCAIPHSDGLDVMLYLHKGTFSCADFKEYYSLLASGHKCALPGGECVSGVRMWPIERMSELGCEDMWQCVACGKHEATIISC